ncbi:MAG: hypothetical protein IJ736_13970 [Firmicutes bacterium]|nr:hypothetical protein [Bacillota bacterium]
MCITEYDEEKTFAAQKKEGSLEMLVNLVKKGFLTINIAAKEAGMSVSEFEVKTGLKTQ